MHVQIWNFGFANLRSKQKTFDVQLEIKQPKRIMLNATQWKTIKCVSTLKQSASFCCMKANKRGGRSICSLKSQPQHKHGFFFSVCRSCWQHSVEGPKIDSGLKAFKLCAVKKTPCNNQPYRPYPESQLVMIVVVFIAVWVPWEGGINRHTYHIISQLCNDLSNPLH